MQESRMVPQMYTTNYGKIIQILLEKLTSLNMQFNTCTSQEEKEKIKVNIDILEEALRIYASSEQNINDVQLREFEVLMKFVLNN